MKTALVGALAILIAAESAAWAWHWPRLRKRKDKPAAAQQKRAPRPRAHSGPAWTGPAGLAALVVQVQARREPRAMKDERPRESPAPRTALAEQR